MGSAQSTRKLTISNDEDLGVIHISKGVAERLAHGVGNQTSAESSKNAESKFGGQRESAGSMEQSTPKASESFYGNPAVHQHPESYTISALKMQQQKEEELNRQNLYWQERLEILKDNHAKIDRILEEEYNRAVNEVASFEGKKKIDLNSVVPPCIENKDKVLRCYQDHPREILKCSSLVQDFSNCVDQRRAGLIAARC